jgi:hypothetical protein
LKDLSKPLNDNLAEDTLPETADGSLSSLPAPQDEMLADNQDSFNRPSVKGAYRPVRNGTIRGSIIALVASAVATGTLSLPIRVQQLGLIPYSIVLILTILVSYYGMIIM